jgi:hypothetical protein
MRKMLSIVALTLAVCAGGVAVPVLGANAQDLELRIGPDGIQPIIRDRDRDRRRVERGRDRCSEREARAAARDFGLRDPEVVRVSERRVVVEGMTRRGPDRITFANVRGCPEI